MYIQLSTLEKGGRFLGKKKKISTSIRFIIQVERDGSFAAARHQVSAENQSGRCRCIRLCNQFSLQQREAHGVKSDSELSTTISYRRSWRRILLTLLMPSPTAHRRGVSCPDSKPHKLMKGWQCWQGSAEPTTPPSLWAQSLHRDTNNRGGGQRIEA